MISSTAEQVCSPSSLLASTSTQGVCGVARHAPMHAHPLPTLPELAAIRPEVVLLGIFSLFLWLLGLISGLLLPLALQRASNWRRSTAAADGDSAAAAGRTPQSRPLSEIDSDEEEEVLLDSSHSNLHHQLLASGSAVTPHWHISDSDLQYYKSVADPVKAKLLTGDLGPGWNFIMCVGHVGWGVGAAHILGCCSGSAASLASCWFPHTLFPLQGSCHPLTTYTLLACHLPACREKEQPGRMRYASYWRPTADDKTDYLSITIVNGATAQVHTAC